MPSDRSDTISIGSGDSSISNPAPSLSDTAVADAIATNIAQTPTVPSAAEELEKRLRREARMKKRLEKKKRKREKLLLDSKEKADRKGIDHGPTRDAKKSKKSLVPPQEEKGKPEKKKIKLPLKPSSFSASVTHKKKRVLKNPSDVKDSFAKEQSPKMPAKPSKQSKISFPINEECTSLKLSPSGRHIIAGFTDGTVRLFDTTGRLWQSGPSKKHHTLNDPIKSEMNNLFDSDSDEEELFSSKASSNRAKQRMVASKSFQNFGAVACQIHARGVITSLLMDVDCCDKGRFAFAGVLRGSTELIALDLSQIEKYHDDLNTKDGQVQDSKHDILDLIKVHRHSDAKLKGFGACVRVKSNTNKLEYRLFTGKGIKNMHIWSFIPPQGKVTEPSWQCLYDTPTNGNTITYLRFRRDAIGLLQGITKSSDDQKLRIWDLSFEDTKDVKKPKTRSIIKQLAEKAEKEDPGNNERPKRPPYVDILSTENALGVCGSYVFSGGDSMYNKMGVMFLDVEDIQSQFNHTELALPGADGHDNAAIWSTNRRSARSGRQQRGELKSVVGVAGLDQDAHHVLLELSDQTLIHYCQKGNQSSLVPLAIPTSDQTDRKMCVTRVKSTASTVLSISSYDSNKNRGTITMRFLSENAEGGSLGSSTRIGFTEPAKKKRQKIRPSITSNKSTVAALPTDKIVAHTPPMKTGKDASLLTAALITKEENLNIADELALTTPQLKPVISKYPEQASKARKKKKKLEPEPSSYSNLLVTPDVKKKKISSRKGKGNLGTASVSPPASEVLPQKQSNDSRNTTPQVKLLGIAVSPEQLNKNDAADMSPPNPNPVTENSISKFFTRSNDEKYISKTSKTKKVQFKNDTMNIAGQSKQTANAITTVCKPPMEDITLQESDIVKALESIRIIASSRPSSKKSIQSNDSLAAQKTRKELDDFLSNCQNRKRPKISRVMNLPPVSTRIGFTAPFYKLEGTGFSTDQTYRTNSHTNIDQAHSMARRQLAMHHRASHERFRNTVISSAERIMNIVTTQNNTMSYSKNRLLDYANQTMVHSIENHKEILRDMISRQEMEAQSLMRIQTLEKGTQSPLVAVSFPFPEVFDQLKSCLKLLSER